MKSLSSEFADLCQKRIEKISLETNQRYVEVEKTVNQHFKNLKKELPPNLQKSLIDLENKRMFQEYLGYSFCYEQGFYDGIKFVMLAAKR
jgi:hypothetical protein